MRTAIVILVALVFTAWAAHWYQVNKGFTPWMVGQELDRFCWEHENHGVHPNFWDDGHWVEAVEGRWHHGIPQYRVRYGASPKGKADHYGWYWYFNQDQAAFAQHVHEFADQGYTLLDPNSFKRPDDTRRYQGVWHKTQTNAAYNAEKAFLDARNQPTPAVTLAPVSMSPVQRRRRIRPFFR